ncbi:MAG TPA: sugar transferase [Dehalococcoidia bacterium]|nr:sugar transferase [Dehalococcoidia bacterium]
MGTERLLRQESIDTETLDSSWEIESFSTLPSGVAGAVYQRFGKRAFDLALAIPLCALATPLILLLAATHIVLHGWPPFHRGRRLGRGGRQFSMWKIRTMGSDSEQQLQEWPESNPKLAAEFARNFKLKHDPRITRFGRFLRRSSLDELPQLWNVLRGDMSLVGPRPIVAEELSNYRDRAGEMLAFRPGISGPWQVSGRNQIAYPERTWFELNYCRTASLAGDLRILLRTLSMPIRFNGL